MAVPEIGAKDFENKVLKNEKPVLVEFFASWCGPCQQLAPNLEKAAHEIGSKAQIFKIDVDKETKLASQYNVLSIPAMIIFKKGEPQAQFSGLIPTEELIKKLS